MAFSVPHALLQADLVLELNGKKVGEILRPAGDIDVSEAVRYGEENAFAWMLTRFGAEARKGQTLWADMDHRNPPGLTRAPELTVTPWTRITDVFCNPSWREKRLRVEIEVTCGEDPSDGDLSVAIRDEAGGGHSGACGDALRLCGHSMGRLRTEDAALAVPVACQPRHCSGDCRERVRRPVRCE